RRGAGWQRHANKRIDPGFLRSLEPPVVAWLRTAAIRSWPGAEQVAHEASFRRRRPAPAGCERATCEQPLPAGWRLYESNSEGLGRRNCETERRIRVERCRRSDCT